MPRTPRVLRVVLVALLTLLGALTALLGQGRDAVAYWHFGELEGLDQAITRHYSLSVAGTDVVALEVEATIARFDGEDAAQAGYDVAITSYASGFASTVPEATPEASEVTGLGDASTAFTTVAHQEILLEWYIDSTILVTLDAVDLIIVTVEYQTQEAPATPASADLAQELTDAILAAPAGEGEPVANADGSYSGGLWDRLPTLDHEALAAAGLDVSWGFVDFPEPVSVDEGTPEDSDTSEDDEFDFSTLEGIQRGVGRFYTGDEAAMQTPETAPAGVYYLVVALIEFDSEDHAAAALDVVYGDWVDSFASDDTFTLQELEPGELGDIGDQSLGARGAAEADGVQVDTVLLAVRDGAYVYLVATVGVGEDSGSLDVATGIARTVIEADAGEGDGTFDEYGGSTGGLWDKMPGEDDPLLAGLTPTSDEMLYPVPAEES
jgi:hypothetical protein